MRAISLESFALAAGFLILGCSSDTGGGEGGAGGGASSSGGAVNPSGGSATTSGASNGGSAGAFASGGSVNAGAAPGGAGAFGSSGATGVGGAAMAGSPNGGSATGGSPSGGGTFGGGGNNGGAGGGGKAGAGAGGAGGGSAGAGGGTSAVDCAAPALTGGDQHCSSNLSGTTGSGYTWTIWSSGSGGCLTSYGKGAAFKATWNNSGDFLSRVGLQWDETKTYDQYGTISADYAYTKTGSAGGYSFIGIYGWSNTPLVEYYIVDDWFGSGPPTGGGTMKGTLSVDGGTYNIYMHTQNNQPSIHGTQTFPQFFSVRQTARQCGHISLTEHFKKWASLGMNLGKMYEAKLLIEAGGGSGSIDYKAASFTTK